MNTKKSLLFLAVCGCLILSGVIASAAEKTTAALVADLKSADEGVRLQAVNELAGVKAAAAVGPLTELLGDKSAAVRAHAAYALGAIGEPAKPAVAALSKLIKDADPVVRRQAVKAIVRIHPGPQVVVPLAAKLLEDADSGVRLCVLQAIAEAGPKAVPSLIEALKNDRTADDYWACLALREIGPAAKAAVPALAEKLKKDARPEIRREIILTLATMDGAAEPAVGAIVEALKNEHTAAAATYALGRIGQLPADAEAVVRANAKSKDKFLSTTSLWTLARIHPEDKQIRREATERLVEGLKDGDAFVRVTSARALAALPPAPEITLPIWEKALKDADEATMRHAMDALATLGAPAVPGLVAALKHENVRDEVAHILGQIGPAAAPATEALANLVADKDEQTAHEATLALAKIGPGAKAAVPALVKALASGEGPNTPAVAYTLGRIGPDAAAAEPALAKLLKSSNTGVALAGAWALVQIRPASAELAAQTLPALTAGLAHREPLARLGAAEALGQLGPAAKTAVPALKKIVSDEEDPAVCDAAAKALALITGDSGVIRHKRIVPLRRRM